MHENSSVNTQELVQLLRQISFFRANLFSADAHTLGFYGTFEGRVHFGIIPQPRRNNLFGGEQRQARIGPCVIHICRLSRQWLQTHSRSACMHCEDRRTIADNCGNLRLAAAFHPWRARESVRRRPESRQAAHRWAMQFSCFDRRRPPPPPRAEANTHTQRRLAARCWCQRER